MCVAWPYPCCCTSTPKSDMNSKCLNMHLLTKQQHTISPHKHATPAQFSAACCAVASATEPYQM